MQFPYWIIILLIITTCKSNISNTSDNVCYDQEVATTPVNTSYLAPVTETVWQYCWTFRIPPKCPVDVVHLEKRTKTENITRVSNIATCCPGYQENDERCVPTCDPHCSHGTCSAPYTCSCAKGYSGAHCGEKGCPGGRWGEGCIMECHCKNGGKCHAVEGTCYCPAGFNGTMCEDKCSNQTFGESCGGTCNCSVGYSCHHISGECVKCSNDTFGDKCEEACDCSENGTALCSHVDGRCFCEANWYGDNCDLDCPFGFSDGACIPSIENQTCSCPSDLFLCDPHLGCVCPLGQDCGIERKVQDQVRVGFMKVAQSSVGVAVTVVFFLVIGIIIFIFVLLNYMRKFRVIKKDLASRTGHVNHCLENNEVTPIPSIRQFPAVENNQISFVRPTQDSAQNPLYIVNYSRPEKNVNIAKAGLERSPSNLNRPESCCGGDDYDDYDEPKEIRNDLRAIFGKGAANNDDDYDSYDHLDHNRTINEVSPNYFKFSK